MTNGIILISNDWEKVHCGLMKIILTFVDNIKANFKDLVTFRININFIQMFENSVHCEQKNHIVVVFYILIQIFFKILQ